jgi:cation transport regulator
LEESVNYQTRDDLPEELRDTLPEEAQDVYLDAYQRAWDAYDEAQAGDLSRHGVAHQQGWAAVRREYTYEYSTGEWHRKGEKPDQEPARQGILERLRNLI